MYFGCAHGMYFVCVCAGCACWVCAGYVHRVCVGCVLGVCWVRAGCAHRVCMLGVCVCALGVTALFCVRMPGVAVLVSVLVMVTVALEATHPDMSHCTSRLSELPGQPLCQYRAPGQRGPQAAGPPNTNPRLWALSNANTQFALRLYQHLADATPVNNIFLSPLSISTAFAMTKLAACGDTLRQLTEVSQRHSRGSVQSTWQLTPSMCMGGCVCGGVGAVCVGGAVCVWWGVCVCVVGRVCVRVVGRVCVCGGGACVCVVGRCVCVWWGEPTLDWSETMMPSHRPQVFKFDTIAEKTSDQTHYFFAKLNCRFYRKINGSSELVSANRLFGEQSLNFNQTFQNISQAVYNAKIIPVNFKYQPEQARAVINGWVAEHTEQRIQDVVPENTLTSNTALVLVNAIYFKGWWKSTFNKEVTTVMDFYRNATSHCKTPMMYQSSSFRFGRFPADGVKVIELPYGTGKVTMVLVLPLPRVSLFEVESKLNTEKLDLWLSSLRSQTVDLTLPKFRVQTSFSVKESLQEMGLLDLFNPEKANLQGLVDGLSDGLYVSDAFHKAFLEVSSKAPFTLHPLPGQGYRPAPSSPIPPDTNPQLSANPSPPIAPPSPPAVRM
uniref:Serpin family C member 1 n=1 Tax=Callorhinchus milii TaxID=7868 RepID=A0A4W3GHN1_CALMI